MKLEDAIEEFEYLEKLPGKKLLLKGNHDYWWTTIARMRNFLKEKGIKTIDFLHNNAYVFEDKIIAGVRGCNEIEVEEKRLKREIARLELSIQEGIKEFGEGKEIIVFTHYPPFTRNNEFINIMKNHGIKRCIYGHLHGESLKDAVRGNKDGIEYIVASCDDTDFKLLTIR